MIIILFIILFQRVGSLYLPSNKNKAINSATVYLEDKYNKQFQYKGINTFIMEPFGYNIGFYDKSSDITANVSVMPNFTAWYDMTPDFVIHTDDYAESYVDNIITKKLNDVINSSNVCSNVENALVFSYTPDKAVIDLYNAMLDDKYTADNYLKNIKYNIIIRMKSDFDYAENDKYAKEICGILSYIQVHGYKAECFFLDYSDDFSLQISSPPDFTLLSCDEGVEIMKGIIKEHYVKTRDSS